MIKAVVDTNIFVSGLLKEEGPSGQLLKLWMANKFILVISRQIIDEIVRVLHYPKIKDNYKLSEERIKALIDMIYLKAEIVEGLYQVEKMKDVTDNKFLSCGLEGKSDYIVTGDSELLNLKFYHGIDILRVANFVKKF